MIKAKSSSSFDRNRTVYIPPLNLSPKKEHKALFRGLLDANAYTNSKPFIDQLTHNTDFAKQKSLYRYQISKNEPKKLQKRSSNNSSCGSLLALDRSFQVQKSINQQNQPVDQLQTFQTLPDKYDEIVPISRSKHFQRRSINRKYIHNQISDGSVILEKQQIFNHEKLQKIKSEDQISEVISHQYMSIIEQLSQAKMEVIQLKSEIYIINIENTKLQQINLQYLSKIQFSQSQNSIMETEINCLKLQLQKINLTSTSFIDQNKLEYQIFVKQEMIHALKNNLKYVELENDILKKTVWQSKSQKEVINQLEKDKKFLEQKVKIMTEFENKRKRMQKSIGEQSSEISFDLSNGEEETADLTPENGRKSLQMPTKKYMNTSAHHKKDN